MTRMNRPKEMAKRNKKIALIAKAMEWIMEHPDAPIDPMLRELAKIVMEAVSRGRMKRRPMKRRKQRSRVDFNF